VRGHRETSESIADTEALVAASRDQLARLHSGAALKDWHLWNSKRLIAESLEALLMVARIRAEILPRALVAKRSEGQGGSPTR
jgi:hypothetical protein